MNSNLKKSTPCLLIVLGLFLLFLINQPILAGACFMICIVIILENIWPEEWEADKEKTNNDGLVQL